MTLYTRDFKRRTESGFTLLELLVTLVILSIGLLGLGLMQTTGLGMTKTAYARTQAMMLAGDIADRVHANHNNAANYVGASAPGAVTCAADNLCLGPALAASDMADWSNRLQIELPGGSGQIADAGATPIGCPAPSAVVVGFMRVVVKWNEVVGGNTGGETGGDCYQFDFVF
jgi:type IV pilus assembly protein PilV